MKDTHMSDDPVARIDRALQEALARNDQQAVIDILNIIIASEGVPHGDLYVDYRDGGYVLCDAATCVPLARDELNDAAMSTNARKWLTAPR
jgi:hypothetical protein